MSQLDMEHIKPKIAAAGRVEDAMDTMPAPETAHHIHLSETIIQDKKYVSDATGFTNQQKWAHVLNVFRAPAECSLFAEINYGNIYNADDATRAEAACFVADLRAQYFSRLLDEKFTVERHLLYVVNRQWMVRFRERAALAGLTQALKGQLLH